MKEIIAKIEAAGSVYEIVFGRPGARVYLVPVTCAECDGDGGDDDDLCRCCDGYWDDMALLLVDGNEVFAYRDGAEVWLSADDEIFDRIVC